MYQQLAVADCNMNLDIRWPPCRLKEYKIALQWLMWMLEKHPDNIYLLSTAGYVQLNIGHTDAAAQSFQVQPALEWHKLSKPKAIEVIGAPVP